MDYQKIKVLGEAAQFDICTACSRVGRVKSPLGRWIYPSSFPQGGTAYLLKVLMSNICENDCLYCVNRRGRNFKGFSFHPQELARGFLSLYQAGRVSGLFLSSAVTKDPLYTMSQMLKTCEILRSKYKFRGYIHLKILPESPFSYVEQAVRLATRVSVNLEVPTSKSLQQIAPHKELEGLLLRMKWIGVLSRRHPQLLPAGYTTQFVVGVSEDTDREILGMTSTLYQKYGLTRSYYSAFQPIPDTPLEKHPPLPLVRERRLYQADFLLRQYGFSCSELIFGEGGNLPWKLDPKMMWALHHPEYFPVEVNKASYRELLRVPGIGPTSAKRILRQRAKNPFRNLEELKSTGCFALRAAPFILIRGKAPDSISRPPSLNLGDDGEYPSGVVSSTLNP